MARLGRGQPPRRERNAQVLPAAPAGNTIDVFAPTMVLVTTTVELQAQLDAAAPEFALETATAELQAHLDATAPELALETPTADLQAQLDAAAPEFALETATAELQAQLDATAPEFALETATAELQAQLDATAPEFALETATAELQAQIDATAPEFALETTSVNIAGATVIDAIAPEMALVATTADFSPPRRPLRIGEGEAEFESFTLVASDVFDGDAYDRHWFTTSEQAKLAGIEDSALGAESVRDTVDAFVADSTTIDWTRSADPGGTYTGAVRALTVSEFSSPNVGQWTNDLGYLTAATVEAQVDHANISTIGTNTHAQLDTHLADGTLHYTEASIDHGSVAGLGDDDHGQYHTDARALTWLGTRSTTDLAEGSGLYHTSERVDDRVAALIQNGTGLAWTYVDGAGTLTGNVGGLTVSEFASPNVSQWTNDSGYLTDAFPRENGFLDRADSTIGFVAGTRTFTIAPAVADFSFYAAGVAYTKSGAENVVIADTEGIHFIYYDGATLSETTTFATGLITDHALVAVVYWDATNDVAVMFADERHGANMDATTHMFNHMTLGARFGSGFGLGNMDVDGNGDDATAAQLSVANGVLWDEDIQHTVTDGAPQDLSAIAEIPVLYQTGASGEWRKVAATQYPITTTGSGRAAWNEWTGAVWQLAEVDNNDFVCMHLYATNDVIEPIVAVMGQAEYNTAGQARAGAQVELNNLAFGNLGSLTPEFVPIATVIFQTSNGSSNAVKSRVRSTDTGDDYIDWRLSKGGAGTSSGTAPTTTFLDSEFTLVDETNLFELTFQLSGLTANRVLTAPDAAGTISLLGDNLSDFANDSGYLTAATVEAQVDHANISTIGTNTHAQLDTHLADGTLHYTEASIDHGSVAGLGDDDHGQYHTDARALTWLGTRSTADLAEGANLYFTNERVDDRANALIQDGTGLAWTYVDGAGTLTGNVDHDASANFLPDEHVAHSGVSIIAGTGLTGGGTVAATRTLDTVQDIATTATPQFAEIGIGTATRDGPLHVVEGGTAGSVAADSTGDTAVFESNGSGGISILTPDASPGALYFGSPGDAVGAGLLWTKDDDVLQVATSTAAGEISLRTGLGTEALRLDVDGNIGIGTAAPGYDVEIERAASANLMLATTGTGTAANFRGEANRAAADLNLSSYVASWNGTNVARIRALSGSDTVNKDDGALSFSTATGGALTEALHIDQDGHVGVGGASSPTYDCQVAGTLNTTGNLYENGIRVSTSDQLLKENITALADHIPLIRDKFMALQPARFSWKAAPYQALGMAAPSAPGQMHFGFIAQNVRSQFPDLVESVVLGHQLSPDDPQPGHEEYSALNGKRTGPAVEYLAVRRDEMIPLLVMLVQWLIGHAETTRSQLDTAKTRIQTLETQMAEAIARIQALEAA